LDHFRKRDAYNSMGLVLAWQGCFQEAQEHHIKALKLALQHRCPNAAMLTYFYLGQVDHRAVFESHDSPKSHKHYRKGLALAEKLQARAVRYVHIDLSSKFELVCKETVCMNLCW
jgi:tetratricopeptide (TPR) repeat protein